jgi:hypothetical protein
MASHCKYQAYFLPVCKNTENIGGIPMPDNVAGGLVM